MLQMESVVSPKTTSEDLKPGGGMNRRMKLYNRMCAHSKFYNTLNKGGKMTEAKEPKTAYIDVKV